MEIWKLKNIADSYTKTKEYRFNNYVVNPHIQNLMGNVRGKNLLEIGCGFGRYLEIFYKENPSKLVGCDISAHQLELCKQYIGNSDIGLHALDFSDQNASVILGQDEYDIVYNIFVILYLDNLDKLKTFITNSYKCLKKDGPPGREGPPNLKLWIVVGLNSSLNKFNTKLFFHGQGFFFKMFSKG